MATIPLDDTPNFAFSTLAQALGAAGSECYITDPSLFPAPTVGYNATIFSASAAGPAEDDNREVVRITAKPGGYSILRGQESTEAREWPAGSKILAGPGVTFFSGLKEQLEKMLYFQLDGWANDNIPANQSTPQGMYRGWPNYALYKTRMLRDCSITRLSAWISAAISAGWIKVEVYVNDVATGLYVTLSAGGLWYSGAERDIGAVEAAENARVDLKYTSSSDLSPTTIDLRGAIEVSV